MAVRRLSNRWTCPLCKRTYNLEFKPPAHDKICDVDGTGLERRADDEELTVRRRLAVYSEQTAPARAVLPGARAPPRGRRPGAGGRSWPSARSRRWRAWSRDHPQVARGAREDAPVGRILAETIDAVLEAVAPGRHHRRPRRGGRAADPRRGRRPVVPGYRGLHAAVRSAPRVNDEIVHGIPSRKRVLREGDLLSLDFGAIWEGFHSDSAVIGVRGRRRPQRRGRPAGQDHRGGAGRGDRRDPARRPPVRHRLRRSSRRPAPRASASCASTAGHGIGRADARGSVHPELGAAGTRPRPAARPRGGAWSPC